MGHRPIGLFIILATLVAAPLGAQNSTQPLNPGQAQPTAKPAPPPSKPAPRSADGKIVIGTVPGEQGIWVGDGRLVINPRSYEPNTTKNAPIHIDNTPLQDWARELVNARHGEFLKDEPHARCKPSGGPREFITPYGFELLEVPELKQVFVFDIGGPHSYRVVYMDGRGHPKDLEPSYYGHSIGRWEGDTLVIDAVGFNEKFWMSRDGLPHTEQLHLTERITRVDYNTLRYEVTIDDPGAYTQPWTSSFNLRWTPGIELFEYQCQGNNFFPESVFGANYFEEGISVVP